MMSSIISFWSGGDGRVDLIDGDGAALFGARHHLLDRSVVEIEQGGIALVLRFDFLCIVFRH